jgi:hypothetical protein
VHVEDGPPITQRTSGLNRAWGTPESAANIKFTDEPTTEQLIEIILGDPELAALIGAKLGPARNRPLH